MKRGIDTRSESSKRGRPTKKQKLEDLTKKINDMKAEMNELKVTIALYTASNDNLKHLVRLLDAVKEIEAPQEIMADPDSLFDETPLEFTPDILGMDQNEGLIFDWKSASDFPLYAQGYLPLSQSNNDILFDKNEEDTSITPEEKLESDEGVFSLRMSQFLS